jgi:hypothetical protein
MKFHMIAVWLGVIAMAATGIVFAYAGHVYAAIGNGLAVAFLCAVGLPWRTLGCWLWRWWTGNEFERKPLPIGGAFALNQDPLRYSDSAKGMFAGFSWRDKNGVVHGDAFRGQTLDDVVNPTETPEQFVRRICPNAKLVPYGQKWRVDFGQEIDERGDTETWNKHHTQEEAWQDAKDELLIANPLAGLTAEQIAARVNRGEPVRLKDAFDALGLKRPTSDNLVVDEAIKATILGGDVYCGEMLVTDAQVQGVTGPLDTLKDVYMLPDGTFTITRPSQDAKPIGRVSKFVKSGVANVQMTP